MTLAERGSTFERIAGILGEEREQLVAGHIQPEGTTKRRLLENNRRRMRRLTENAKAQEAQPHSPLVRDLPRDEQLQLALAVVCLEDGRSIGEASPQDVLQDIEERIKKLNAVRGFLAFCPAKAETIRDGMQLAKERADIIDNVNAAWSNLTECLCDDRGYTPSSLTADQSEEISRATNELVDRWKAGDESITEAVLQKRLQAYVDMDQRLTSHEVEYGVQVWSQYRTSIRDTAEDGSEKYREGVNERLDDNIPGWEKNMSREEALYQSLTMLDQAIEQGAEMRAIGIVFARAVGAIPKELR